MFSMMDGKKIGFICLFLITLFDIYSGIPEDISCYLENGAKGQCVIINSCAFTKSMNETDQMEICGIINEKPMICCPSRLSGKRSVQECYKYGQIKKPEFGSKEDLVAKAKEFPHLALIGYDDDIDESKKKWLCTGSLISEQFVLSGANCAFRPGGAAPRFAKWIRLGDLDYKNPRDDAKRSDFTIIQSFMPNRKKPYTNYDKDIALFKLDRKVELSDYVRPACLNTQKSFPVDELVTAGWGQKGPFEDYSSRLLKIKVKYIDHEKCMNLTTNMLKFMDRNKLSGGIIDDEHICTGAVEGKDTCPANAGGPLQIKVEATPTSSWYYSIVGTTNFGTNCGRINELVVFTNVAQYIGWIEDIVWPDMDPNEHY